MTDAVEIIRVELPSPDAVIVERSDGRMVVVADLTLPEDVVKQYAEEARTLRCASHVVG